MKKTTKIKCVGKKRTWLTPHSSIKKKVLSCVLKISKGVQTNSMSRSKTWFVSVSPIFYLLIDLQPLQNYNILLTITDIALVMYSNKNTCWCQSSRSHNRLYARASNHPECSSTSHSCNGFLSTVICPFHQMPHATERSHSHTGTPFHSPSLWRTLLRDKKGVFQHQPPIAFFSLQVRCT